MKPHSGARVALPGAWLWLTAIAAAESEHTAPEQCLDREPRCYRQNSES